MIWKILFSKNAVTAYVAIATLLGLYTLLNTTVIKPRVAKQLEKATAPILEDLTATRDALDLTRESVRLKELMIVDLRSNIDSLETSSTLYYATQNRLQRQIYGIAKQNRELKKGFRIDAIVIRTKRNGTPIDSVIIENYRKF